MERSYKSDSIAGNLDCHCLWNNRDQMFWAKLERGMPSYPVDIALENSHPVYCLKFDVTAGLW